MAEILIILWFSVVCCMVAGFILGYFLGKARTIKQLDTPYTKAQVNEIIQERNELERRNADLECEYVSRETKIHARIYPAQYTINYDATAGQFIITFNEKLIQPYPTVLMDLILVESEVQE